VKHEEILEGFEKKKICEANTVTVRFGCNCTRCDQSNVRQKVHLQASWVLRLRV